MTTLSRSCPFQSSRQPSLKVKADIDKFIEFAKSHKEKPLILTGHTYADNDTVGSCFALKALFLRAIIALQNDPLLYARPLIKALGLTEIKLLSEVDPLLPVVLCDTRSNYLTRYLAGRKILAVIDHHNDNGMDIRAPVMVVDSTACSASLLIYEILIAAGVKIDAKAAIGLATGIMSDCETQEAGQCAYVRNILNELMLLGKISLKEISRFSEPVLSENNLKFLDYATKSSERLVFRSSHGDIHVLLGKVDGPLRLVLADRLVSSDGNDIVIVLGNNIPESPTVHVSIRVKQWIADLGLSAYMFAEKIGRECKGNGGGHNLRGGATSFLSLEETRLRIKEVLHSILNR